MDDSVGHPDVLLAQYHDHLMWEMQNQPHFNLSDPRGPRIGGIGPGGFVTNSTPTGEQLAIILPYGRWVDTGADANAPQFRILPLVMLAKMGVRLVQNHRGRDQSVLECMRTGRIVNMVSDNGILCGAIS